MRRTSACTFDLVKGSRGCEISSSSSISSVRTVLPSNAMISSTKFSRTLITSWPPLRTTRTSANWPVSNSALMVVSIKTGSNASPTRIGTTAATFASLYRWLPSTIMLVIVPGSYKDCADANGAPKAANALNSADATRGRSFWEIKDQVVIDLQYSRLPAADRPYSYY